MKKVLPITILAGSLMLTLAACSAPKGKTYAAMNRPVPVAAGEAQDHAELYESTPESSIVLNPNGTVTLWLSSKPGTGYSWRLSEIPDPTVLTLVSKEYVPPAKSNVGQEKWIFQATGGGTVDLRLWYTSGKRERFGTAPVLKCIVTVENERIAEGPSRQNRGVSERTYAKPRPKAPAKPKVHRTTPDPETAPFLEPVFRSSRVLLRDEHDRSKQQG